MTDEPWLRRALVLGDGVFETLRTYDRRPLLLEAHARRFLNSADILLFEHGHSLSDIVRAVEDAIVKDRSKGESVVRIVLTSDGDLFVMTDPWKGHPEEVYSKGLRLWVSTWRRVAEASFPTQAKSTSYAQFLLVQREAKRNGFDDAIILSHDGAVCETSRSNIFLVNDEGLCTPSLESGVFPGITREVVSELARESGYKVQERRVGLEDLLSSAEAFLTSSLLELAPVASIDDRPISKGGPGKVSMSLRERYLEKISR
jgi:branched-chain amino acid aminotransferase